MAGGAKVPPGGGSSFRYTLYTNGATLYKSSTERSETSVEVSTTSNNGSTDIYGDKFCDPTDYPVSDHNSSNGWMSYGYHFVYDGYTFSHWNTAADGSGTSYYIGDTPQSNGVYYAIWEEIQYGYQDEICNIMGCLPMGASLEPSETSNSPTLIEFTIAGTTYQAEEGMTWSEWVNSKYNTIGAYINYGKVFLTAQYRVGGEGETYVNATSNIVENGTYSPMAGGAN